MAIGAYLDVICEVFNNQGITRLIDINGDAFKGITDYPTMKHGDIESPDLAQFSAFIKDMVGAGIVQPDEQLEEEVRRVGGLPEKLEGNMPVQEEKAEESKPGSNLYKITSVLDKYHRGTMTRKLAQEMLGEIGIEPERVEAFLQEADTLLESDKDDAAQAEEAKKSLGR